jgi:Fe2+ transport system protein FeoA
VTEQPAASPERVPLDRLPPSVEAMVVDVPPQHRSELAGEGLRVGRTVHVTGRAPFGGPVLLMVGRARLAVSRSVASGILVERVTDTPRAAHATAPAAETGPVAPDSATPPAVTS